MSSDNWMFATPFKVGEFNITKFRNLREAQDAFALEIYNQAQRKERPYDDQGYKLAKDGIYYTHTCDDFINFASQHLTLVGEFSKQFKLKHERAFGQCE